MAACIIPRHQWTHDGGDVLIVRYVATDGASSHGFVYPLRVGATVQCPDWEPTAQCGHGLHGWAWGFSLGEGAAPDWAATWLVIAATPADVIAINGKVKFRAGVVRYAGTWQGATEMVLAGQRAWVHHAASGAAEATGARGAASATGERGAASATGWSGAASATGANGAASATGERGAASATGANGAASATGEASVAVVTGDDGRAMAGEYGCIALAFFNARYGRMEMRCAPIGGRHGLKPHVWYRLNGCGAFIEAEE